MGKISEFWAGQCGSDKPGLRGLGPPVASWRPHSQKSTGLTPVDAEVLGHLLGLAVFVPTSVCAVAWEALIPALCLCSGESKMTGQY